MEKSWPLAVTAIAFLAPGFARGLRDEGLAVLGMAADPRAEPGAKGNSAASFAECCQ